MARIRRSAAQPHRATQSHASERPHASESDPQTASGRSRGRRRRRRRPPESATNVGALPAQDTDPLAQALQDPAVRRLLEQLIQVPRAAALPVNAMGRPNIAPANAQPPYPAVGQPDVKGSTGTLMQLLMRDPNALAGLGGLARGGGPQPPPPWGGLAAVAQQHLAVPAGAGGWLNGLRRNLVNIAVTVLAVSQIPGVREFLAVAATQVRAYLAKDTECVCPGDDG